MKVVVTGGSGELGTLVLRRLAADRAITNLVSIDVRPPAVASSRLRAVRADVRDPDLDQHFAGAEAVVHLAFLVTQHTSGGDAVRVSMQIHLELTGPGGGDVTLALDQGRLAIARCVPRPPDSVLTLRASTFLDLLSDRTSIATAVLTGAIRSEGEPIATQVLSAVIAMFLAEARRRGARTWPARQLARWIRGRGPHEHQGADRPGAAL